MTRVTKATRVVCADEGKAWLEEAPPRTLVSPFKRLGVQELEGIAPILVAALAIEEPLLLIGPHGTAKSLLLTRVASALGLEFLHHIASLIKFDDLDRFPLPGKVGRLKAIVTGQTAEVYRDVAPLLSFSKTLRATEIYPQYIPLCRGASTRSIFTSEV